jgi:predicted transcriptional regulator
MKQPAGSYLSKREQQIMEQLYQHGTLAASEIVPLLPGQPSNSTVRTQLRILEERGHVERELVDGKYIYRPSRPKESEGKSALGKVVDTFFKGSVSQTVAALLDENETIDPDELAELEQLIAQARREQR